MLQPYGGIPQTITIALLEVTHSAYSFIHHQPPMKDLNKRKTLVAKEIAANLSTEWLDDCKEI